MLKWNNSNITRTKWDCEPEKKEGKRKKINKLIISFILLLFMSIFKFISIFGKFLLSILIKITCRLLKNLRHTSHVLLFLLLGFKLGRYPEACQPKATIDGNRSESIVRMHLRHAWHLLKIKSFWCLFVSWIKNVPKDGMKKLLYYYNVLVYIPIMLKNNLTMCFIIVSKILPFLSSWGKRKH